MVVKTEAEVSQDPQICSQQAGDPRKVDMQFQSQCKGRRTGKLETQKEPRFQFKSKGQTDRGSNSEQLGRKSALLLVRGQPFCSIQAFKWVDEVRESDLLYSVYLFES